LGQRTVDFYTFTLHLSHLADALIQSDLQIELWYAILNKCSIDLITLIVDQLKKYLIEMDNTIEEKRRAGPRTSGTECL
jgi:hypothetical protein